MEIVFFTNTLNHHHIGWADELFRLTEGNYTLVETQPLNEARRKMGFMEYERPYKLKAYESTDNRNKAFEIAINADVAIMGAESFPYLEARIKKGGKLTFSFSERWLKKGLIGLASPRLFKLMRLYHLHRGKSQPWFVLGASAYLKDDFNILRAFKDKCFKSGYFTISPSLDINKVIESKREEKKIKILWVGRHLKWKHPEVMIRLAKKLMFAGVNFEINMIGTGVLKDALERDIQEQKIIENIHLLGSLPNLEVIKAMREHHIACFTSDRNEGWGAVLNEAMSQGCCPVSSIETGSTPYLIKDGVNGFSFSLKKENDLFEKVMYLIEHPKEREKMSIEAYKTIRDVWSPENAAKSLIALIEDIQNGKDDSIVEGPCSKA